MQVERELQHVKGELSKEQDLRYQAEEEVKLLTTGMGWRIKS